MAKKPPKAIAPLDPGALPWLLVSAIATTAPHASHLPIWLSLLVGAILLWRIGLVYAKAALPARTLLALVVIGGTAGIGWEFHTLFGRDSGVALLALFMALKLMELRARRDAMVIVFLGYFLLLTHYFYSQSIPTGLWLMLSATLLTATLIRVQGGAQPMRFILRYAGVLIVQAVPLMLIAFVLFPRVSGPLWGLPRDAYAGLTGLSDQMSPGSLNALIQSGEIAFRVQFNKGMPEKSKLYWRGPVLNDYDGKVWRERPPGTARVGKPPVIESDGQTYDYVTTLEAHNQRWLLALDLPTKLPENSALMSTLDVRSREPVIGRARFAFSSAVDFVVNRQETAAQLQQSRRLPAGLNPRTRALAVEWQAQFQTPEAIADAALRNFRQQAFFYTLRPPLLGENAVDDFLFGTRRGFCEHYASAFVVLMRAAGVPARVVTGYQGGEVNPVDGYLTVRQSDAHAWAEIWVADKGWLRVDPTAAVAPSRIERGIEAALPAGDPLPALVRIDTDWLRMLRDRWEAANNSWNQWVLGYNPLRQRELLSRFGFDEPDWRSMAVALMSLSALALLLVSAWTLYQRPTGSPEQRAWNAYCARLKRRGVMRADWEGPYDFAARVGTERPELSALTREAAEYFADLRYGVGANKRNATGREARLKSLKDCTRRLARIPVKTSPTRWRKTV